jgi:NTE family protein
LHHDSDYKRLQPLGEYKRQLTIVHLINRRLASSSNAKDYEFSRTTVRQLWQAGLDDVRRTVAHRAWLEARELVEGVRVFDLAG